MDVSVADAVEVREHRHARIVLHPRDQALAAARHDHVDQARGAQHRADRLAVLRRHQLDRLGRHARRRQPFDQRGMDRAVRMDRLAAAAQQHRVAAPQAQRRGIGGDVGAAFVDDPDQADRDAHARQLEPARSGAAVDHLADRIGQRGDRFDRRGDALEPAVVEPEPVEHRPRQAVRLARGEVAGVGFEDRAPSAARSAAAAERSAAALPASSIRASSRCAARPARARSATSAS